MWASVQETMLYMIYWSWTSVRHVVLKRHAIGLISIFLITLRNFVHAQKFDMCLTHGILALKHFVPMEPISFSLFQSIHCFSIIFSGKNIIFMIKSTFYVRLWTIDLFTLYNKKLQLHFKSQFKHTRTHVYMWVHKYIWHFQVHMLFFSANTSHCLYDHNLRTTLCWLKNCLHFRLLRWQHILSTCFL